MELMSDVSETVTVSVIGGWYVMSVVSACYRERERGRKVESIAEE
jgi:hypothetical protein